MIRTALMVAAVFLVAGLTWWLLSRSQPTPDQAPAPLPPVAAPAVAPAAALAAPAEMEPAPALRVDAERLAAPPAASELAPDAATLDELLDQTPEPAVAPAVEPEPGAVDVPEASETVPPATVPPPPAPAGRPEPLPLKDMPASYRSEFPPLSVQVHVYDANPLRRFVLVNGKKYRETDGLIEGPRVEEIVPDGVILEHRGSRVLLELPH